MEIIEEQHQEFHHSFKISLPGKEIEEEISRRLHELTKTTKLAGFRPGKVPRHIVEERLGDKVSEEVIQDKVTHSVTQLFEERNFQPLRQPIINIQHRKPGEDLLFSVDLDVAPHIELPNFSTMRLEKWTVEISEELIQDSLQNLLDQHSKLKPLAQPRPIQDHDVLLINYKLFHQGEIKALQNSLQIRIGKDTMRLGRKFEEQLIGLISPQEKDIEIVLPENHDALSGETVHIKVTVQEVYDVEEQQLDDDFARKLGVQDVNEVKKMIELNLTYQIERLSLLHMRNHLLNYLEKHHKCPIPEFMVCSELEKIWTQYQKQRQEKPEEYVHENKSRSEFDAEYTLVAERRVFLGLFFLETKKQHNITVETQEVDSYLHYVVRQNKSQNPTQDFYRLKRNKPLIEALTNEILEHKVYDFILENVHLTTKNVSLYELQNAIPS